jgi:hypothetical protein
MTKKSLMELYVKYKDSAPVDAKWTQAEEEELNQLESGHITSLEETAIFGRAAEANEAILKAKLQAQLPNRRLNILSHAFEDFQMTDLKALQRTLASVIEKHNDEDNGETLSFISEPVSNLEMRPSSEYNSDSDNSLCLLKRHYEVSKVDRGTRDSDDDDTSEEGKETGGLPTPFFFKTIRPEPFTKGDNSFSSLEHLSCLPTSLPDDHSMDSTPYSPMAIPIEDTPPAGQQDSKLFAAAALTQSKELSHEKSQEEAWQKPKSLADTLKKQQVNSGLKDGVTLREDEPALTSFEPALLTIIDPKSLEENPRIESDQSAQKVGPLVTFTLPPKSPLDEPPFEMKSLMDKPGTVSLPAVIPAESEKHPAAQTTIAEEENDRRESSPEASFLQQVEPSHQEAPILPTRRPIIKKTKTLPEWCSPKHPTRKRRDGTYVRPAGKARKHYDWDVNIGKWHRNKENEN